MKVSTVIIRIKENEKFIEKYRIFYNKKIQPAISEFDDYMKAHDEKLDCVSIKFTRNDLSDLYDMLSKMASLCNDENERFEEMEVN